MMSSSPEAMIWGASWPKSGITEDNRMTAVHGRILYGSDGRRLGIERVRVGFDDFKHGTVPGTRTAVTVRPVETVTANSPSPDCPTQPQTAPVSTHSFSELALWEGYDLTSGIHSRAPQHRWLLCHSSSM